MFTSKFHPVWLRAAIIVLIAMIATPASADCGGRASAGLNADCSGGDTGKPSLSDAELKTISGRGYLATGSDINQVSVILWDEDRRHSRNRQHVGPRQDTSVGGGLSSSTLTIKHNDVLFR